MYTVPSVPITGEAKTRAPVRWAQATAGSAAGPSWGLSPRWEGPPMNMGRSR